jgi:hypothetical protein
MGILKKLTDEYFGDTVRSEDGKKITVHGCDVIVPVIWDENDFLKSVETVLFEDTITEFVDGYWYKRIDTSKSTNIECGNSYHLCISKYDEIIDEEYLTTEEIPNETTYNSIIKFITYIVKDVVIDTEHNKDYIRLTGEGKIDDAFFTDDLGEFEIQNAYDDLITYFLEDFGEKANIKQDDLHSIEYRGSTLNLPIEFKTLLYAREMIKWWDDTLSEIEKQGSKRYFGYDDEEE